jgi:hypothetical protein
MATELDRDTYGVIRYHQQDGMLELEWLAASAKMTDDDFKASIGRYAQLAGDHSTPYLLVDLTNFRHSPGKGMGAWRDEHIIPAYNAAGVEKFAFLSPPGAPGTVEDGNEPAKEPPGEFQTGYFLQREGIVDWFGE